MPMKTSKIPLLLGVLVSLHTTAIAQTTISGLRYTTQPIVIATDEHGNIDKDYGGSVTLSSEGLGMLGGTVSQTAVEGMVTYNDINYSAMADNEFYRLIASDDNISEANSSGIISDVVATQLTFGTQPSPLALTTGIEERFSVEPIVQAVNDQGLVDINFSEMVTLGHNGMERGIFTHNRVTAIEGIATFTGLTFNYDTTATIVFVADDENEIGSNLAQAFSSALEVTAPKEEIKVNYIEVENPTDAQHSSRAEFDSALEIEIENQEGVQTITAQIGEEQIDITLNTQGATRIQLENQSTGATRQIESALVGMQTAVEADGSLRSTTTLVNGNELKVEASSKEEVLITLQTPEGAITKIASSVGDISVAVDDQGSMSLTSTLEKNGFIYKAIITTDNEGKSNTKFIKIDLATNEQTDLSHTLKEGENFGVGNEVILLELEDMIYIEVLTPLDNNQLEIE
ncbi:MAG: Unknown protein [uncultured Sulfurovum sp.]|uniref:Uncharacterized protein n=1 Tax=uncultured Sulfurovum sp. TaxID=269237 RepID=A0A6S6SHT6_9BACT|nr:MAG: Unknown protein [uncultured Sulfurovum sp.]